VITLLTALLIPALSAARRQARTVVCQSNLKQWGLIASAYNAEYPDRLMACPLPWVELHVAAGPDHGYRNEKMCLCPAATRCDRTTYVEGERPYGCGGKSKAWWAFIYLPDEWPNAPASGLFFYCGSYGYSHYLHDETGLEDVIVPDERRSTMYRHWTVTKVKRPSEIPSVFDSAYTGCEPSETDDPPAFDGDLPPGVPSVYSMKQVCIDRHGHGTTNVGFLDGSVRKVGLKELWTLKWHAEYNTANEWTKAGGVQPEDWPEWMYRFRDY
jgi:prepilin-type processing-associated H-X9-DG protein